LAEYVDGQLDAAAEDAIVDHLAECARCRQVVIDTLALIRESGRPAPDDGQDASDARKGDPRN
jgi:anti-sigma factor RsiW